MGCVDFRKIKNDPQRPGCQRHALTGEFRILMNFRLDEISFSFLTYFHFTVFGHEKWKEERPSHLTACRSSVELTFQET